MLLSRGFMSSVIFCIHLFLPTHCMQMLESFFFLSISGSFVSLSLLMSLCVFVFFLCLFEVFLVCVYLWYLPSPVVLSFLFDVDLKIRPGVSRVSWRAGLDFLRVLRLPTTAVSVWCGCKVDEAFQGIKQKDA